MSEFNRVHYTCPHCNNSSSEQVHDGWARNYTDLNDMPASITDKLTDQDRVAHCQHCGGRVVFRFIPKLSLEAVKWENDIPTSEEIVRVQAYLARQKGN